MQHVPLAPVSRERDFEIHEINDTDAFEGLKKSWDTLLQQNMIQDVFLSWEWLLAWWKTHQESRKLKLITVKLGNEVVGIAPLMLERRSRLGLKFKVLTNLGVPQCDIGGFLIREGDTQITSAICTYLINSLDEWDVMELAEFSENSPEIGVLKALFGNAKYSLHIKTNCHLYVPIQTSWDDYYRSLSRNLRNGIKRRIRRANEIGKLSFRRFTGREVTWQHFTTVFKISQHTRFPLVYQPQQEQAFQKELLNLMGRRGWIDIQFLFLDDQPLAFQQGFSFERRYECWRIGLDRHSHQSLAMGKILTMLCLQDSFEKGYAEIDFLRGEEDYKSEWQPHEKKYLEIRVVAKRKISPLFAYILLPRLKTLLPASMRISRG
jgi:CelD/BcsL family acetyltransferase involved in cellulose biosynthesis